MPTLPTLPSIPIPSVISHFFSLFPLVTYPAPSTSTPPPSLPTLWLLGPPPSTSAKEESLDPSCRQAQALARFSTYQLHLRWLIEPAGAPGEQLPALHFPNGELLGAEELLSKMLGSDDSTTATPDPTHQAYTSLLQTTLLPSVLSSLYLSPSPLAITPTQPLPYLTALAASFSSHQTRTARIAQIKQLRGGKQGSKIPLDLEAVEREAVAALGALEVKMRETEAEGEWFGGVQNPTPLDATLYTLLSIILELPHSSAGALKEKLDRCPALLAWVKGKRP